MKLGIIGCGLIGRKRANAIEKNDIIVGACDVNIKTGKKFASDYKTKYFQDYKKLILETKPDIVVVAVVNKFIKEVVNFALMNNVHVIAEKPLGRNTKEAAEMFNTLKKQNSKSKNKLILKTGFNHRFHPAMLKAREYLDKKLIGDVMFIRAVYGHGGRNGMEKEWRASKDLCGGGELLDQGVHIIDLCRWFAGDMKEIFGKVDTKFWNMKVEDNAFVYMKSKSGVDIQFNVSWTNWKNKFLFEIFGKKGYIKIEGLGGSYGNESIELGIRKPEGGVPIIKKITYPKFDYSWKKEWKELKNAISKNKDVLGNHIDGYMANVIIENIYKSSKENKSVKIAV
ncbi:MAG TPA: Gfo/Idh/MocA family oxidoreductase [Ignavibacteria bacterium]|nr:Gfo/Idh/MocA family oxidoreductase [Ignavibacteria bacterium]